MVGTGHGPGWKWYPVIGNDGVGVVEAGAEGLGGEVDGGAAAADEGDGVEDGEGGADGALEGGEDGRAGPQQLRPEGDGGGEGGDGRRPQLLQSLQPEQFQNIFVPRRDCKSTLDSGRGL